MSVTTIIHIEEANLTKKVLRDWMNSLRGTKDKKFLLIKKNGTKINLYYRKNVYAYALTNEFDSFINCHGIDRIEEFLFYRYVVDRGDELFSKS
mgnify:CR=1 FL=1